MIVVIGVGNAWRADDGAGPALAARLRWLEPYGVRVVALDGEPARIVEAWDGAEEAIVVDACLSHDEPGTVREVDADVLVAEPERHGGSHGFGVATAYELGRALQRLPARLRVYTVAAEDLSMGEGLSPAVGQAVDDLAGRIALHLGVEGPLTPL
jgi:hydrogenase maturation protease